MSLGIAPGINKTRTTDVPAVNMSDLPYEKQAYSIRICLGSACYSKARHDNLEFIENFLKENHLLHAVDFRGHLCIGQCNQGPNIEINGTMYHEVNREKLAGILQQHFPVNTHQ